MALAPLKNATELISKNNKDEICGGQGMRECGFRIRSQWEGRAGLGGLREREGWRMRHCPMPQAKQHHKKEDGRETKRERDGEEGGGGGGLAKKT